MSQPPAAIALGDQVHAEITDRAMTDIAAVMRSGDMTPSEDEQLYIEIGVQAGMQAAMRVLVEHGWLLKS